MAFLSLLATAVCILSAMGLVVVGLVEAPWQVLLVGLLAALYGLQRVVQGAGEEQMLGLPLRSHPLGEVAPPVPTAEAEAAETGVSSTPPAAAATADQPGETHELTYRGIRYRVAKAVPSKPGRAELDNSPQSSAGPTEGIYRGHPWRR